MTVPEVTTPDLDGTALPPPPPIRRRRFHLARHSRRSYFAIKASEGSVVLPVTKPLGYLAQAKLVRAAHAGDRKAKQVLWSAHARLTYSAVNRFRVHLDDVPDAIQTAQIGLARAIDKFEVERLNEFSTYAYHWLRQTVQRFRHRNSFFIPIPADLYGAYIVFRRRVVEASSPDKWFDAREELLQQSGDQYRRLLQIHVIAEPGKLTPSSRVSTEAHSPLAQLATAERARRIHDAVDSLPERDRFIVLQRYGLYDQTERTLEEIGQQLNLTRERVRQIQDIAEAKLRRVLADLDIN